MKLISNTGKDLFIELLSPPSYLFESIFYFVFPPSEKHQLHSLNHESEQ